MTTRYLTEPDRVVFANGIIAVMQNRLPGWDADDSDPGVYWADDTSTTVIDLVRKINVAADATFILTALKPAIYDLLTEVGITHTPAHEGMSEDELRVLYFEAWEGLNAYVPSHWLPLSRRILPGAESYSYTLSLGTNTVTLYLAGPGGTDYGASARQEVQDYLNHPDRKPLWDFTVASITVTPYTIDANIKYRQGILDIEQTIRDSSDIFFRESRLAGEGVATSAMIDGLWADGVLDIDISTPSADLDAMDNVIYHGSLDTITYVEVA